MNIYKSVALGIFACVCFLGGFLIGEWATYSKKTINDISKGYSEHFEYTVNAMELLYAANNLSALKKIKDGRDVDTQILVLSSSLSKKIEKLENNLDKYPYKERKFVFEPQLKIAKEALAN